ncbi:MAG: hypothetical protein AB1632_06955, partial [Nitrospirota bacterium]
MLHKISRMRKAAIVSFVISVLLLIGASGYSADYANPQLLVKPADIEKNAAKWVVLDCRDQKDTADKKTQEILK